MTTVPLSAVDDVLEDSPSGDVNLAASIPNPSNEVWVCCIVSDQQVNLAEGDDGREARTSQLRRVSQGDDATGAARHHCANLGYEYVRSRDALFDCQSVAAKKHDISGEFA